MALVSLPTCPTIIGKGWRYNAPTQVNRSEWTSHRKVTELPAAPRWMAEVASFDLTTDEQFWAWNRFFGAMKGRGNSFQLVAVRKLQITGITVRANGGGQVGYSLVTDGWGAAGLKAGQFITVNDQLMRLMADVNPSGGAATLTFDRWLRAPVADNTVVEVSLPYALVSLAQDDSSIIDNSTPWNADGDWTVPGFAVEEAF
ncbi:hypothetical protein [Sphingomonas montanisoli]|uniref:Uncharacterized protein n=1 Tax=Sphingomonas montanisoli TaxID=2606412 RepID=A0A5D9C6F5_9SPHN|nr:hypothetical protein [Sphingomonas montanisoli]TZG25575.1 hypothetical protein FYJ91_11140 [Sphingomonas montanisoli]